MKIGIVAIALSAVTVLGLWLAGVIGGEKVYGSEFLDDMSNGPVGAQIYMIIGIGGVPEGLEVGTEITVGSEKTGEPYCRAKILHTVENADNSGYGVECIETR